MDSTSQMQELRSLYDAYVATYREGSALPPMMELKRVHTVRVVENAERIVAVERFSPREAEACLAAALLHDTGRYEQLRRYNTFRDSDSVDHAVFSHDIVVKRGWLVQAYGPDDPQLITAILNAVRYHNRRDLPDGMDPLSEIAAKCVRDADKLDIFRVLEERIATTDWRHDTTAFWNLRYDLDPNPLVVSAVKDGRPVDYQNIKSLADFVLIQVGWLKSGLYYAASRALAAERGHYDFRRQFLLDLCGFDILKVFASRNQEGLVQ